MTSDGTHTYAYDAEGNITTVDGGGTAAYVYDALNRRVGVALGGAGFEYLFDYAGRRVSTWMLHEPGYPAGFGGEGRVYWDSAQLAYRAFDGTTYFDHQDWLGTERMRTTYAGAVAATFASLPFGDGSDPAVAIPDGDQDNHLFAALDADTDGTDHAQFRQYSPAQGRWLSPDPYDGSYDLSNPQSLNRYAYALNNPLSYIDPLGLATPSQSVLPPLIWLNGTSASQFGEGWDEFYQYDTVCASAGCYTYGEDAWNGMMADGYGGGITDDPSGNGDLDCLTGVCGNASSFGSMWGLMYTPYSWTTSGGVVVSAYQPGITKGRTPVSSAQIRCENGLLGASILHGIGSAVLPSAPGSDPLDDVASAAKAAAQSPVFRSAAGAAVARLGGSFLADAGAATLGAAVSEIALPAIGIAATGYIIYSALSDAEPYFSDNQAGCVP
jgi:RHS repeat-associated protein